MANQPPKTKAEIRASALNRRRGQPDKDQLSRDILARLREMPEYANARTVMFYVHARSEVRTSSEILTALTQGKQVVVPYCEGDELELFRLHTMDELATGVFGILEPRIELRDRSERRCPVAALDLVLVPGVAYDRLGARLGHGAGYYDRLLGRVSRETPLFALAYDCQVFDHIPMETHDIFMNKVITETATHEGRR